MQQIYLIRHGETEWSLSGAHTGRTDIPLTDNGRKQAAALGRFLATRKFAIVLCSPLQRAYETCRLAGFDGAQIDPNLSEWDYGYYEGRTTTEIRRQRPNWSLWTDGVPNGETIQQLGVRADAVIARLLPVEGDAALFAHGHILRALTARWLGLEPAAARFFALGTASIGTLGYERDTRVITRWNLTASELPG